MTYETQYKKAFWLLCMSIRTTAVMMVIMMGDAMVWFVRLILNHKLITALVISMVFNILALITHMNDAYGREHQEYEYIQLEEKYDSLRMANVKYVR